MLFLRMRWSQQLCIGNLQQSVKHVSGTTQAVGRLQTTFSELKDTCHLAEASDCLPACQGVAPLQQVRHEKTCLIKDRKPAL